MGTASATVAVPSRKCTNCAPSKYAGYGMPIAMMASATSVIAIATGFARGLRPTRS
jgi:hypothetical protein